MIKYKHETPAGKLAPEAVLSLAVSRYDSTSVWGERNMDGEVDFFDISSFIELLTSNTFQAEADINEDGEVTFFDIQPFIDILSGQ